MTRPRRGARPSLRGVWGVWALYAVVVAAVFATYARLPVADLYHVSDNGRVGGLSRALVVLNFPVALAAIALAAFAAARARDRAVTAAAVVAVVLCAAVAWPGVVDQADLDAKWSNALAAVGVALAFVVTVAATVRDGVGTATRARGDRLGLVAILVIAFVSVPFITAELGFLVTSAWPVLGSIFYSDEWFAPFGHARLHRAVHEGHHHGMDGALLTVTAIVLSRDLARVPGGLRGVLRGYLALMLVYGFANFLQDVWYEQLVKRGVTEVQIPSLLVPTASWPWLGLVVVAAAVARFVFRDVVPGEPVTGRPLRWAAAACAVAIATLLGVGLAHSGGDEPTPFRSVEGIAYAYAPTGKSHIFLTRPGADAQLTKSGRTELAPDWSRRGELAFQSNRDGDWDVYVRRADGSVAQLTNGDEAEGEPAWRSDGSRIAFVSDGDAYVVTAAGGRTRKLADDVRWPTWTPRAEAWAFETEAARVPKWSGMLVAYGCLRDDRWHICVTSEGTGSTRALTHGDSNDFAPAWSPDGSRLAFVSDRDGNDQIYVMNADGSSIFRITTGQGDKDTPAWQP